jgi:hypothetical protein
VDDEPLGDGELEILVDGLSDEVAFIYVLSHLGLVDASEAAPGPDRAAAVEQAIDHLRRLVDRELIQVGRTEYVDVGPPGRLAPYRHVAEPPTDVWTRLRQDSLNADPHALDWSCWSVNTTAGDALARRYLDRQGTDRFVAE